MNTIPDELPPLTYADLAIRLSKIGRMIAMAQCSLAEGMHNPNFCSADARNYTASIIEDLKREMKYLDRCYRARS